jgi:hypothetical protein
MFPGKAIHILTLMQLITMLASAQRTDTVPASVNLQLQDNQATFSSSLRPLRQIAGAPAAFYSYFWEFGDGTFSFEEQPRHVYKDTGIYDIRLFATNNYDDGKPPPTRPKPLRVNQTKPIYAANNNPAFFKQGGAIEMKVNRMPRPDDDLVLIMAYRNQDLHAAISGSLVLFYNEKQFRKNNFDLLDERMYNNEKKTSIQSIALNNWDNEIIEKGSLPALAGPNASDVNIHSTFRGGKFSQLIADKMKLFRQNNVWQFSNLQKGEEKYFFLTLHTTPEMIKDTNAVVVLNGLFVPDDPNGDIEEYQLELQIVASHDPNRMVLRNQRLNYRFTGKQKEMTYKVQFQNAGRGPSREISIGIRVPPMLDPHSLEILGFQPRAVMCDSAYSGQSCLDTIIHKDSIWFVFKNIYLPGLRQQGFSDIDSTTGFVKYRMHFSKELKKLPFESGAVIVFDKNKPIRTNGARGYFKPGNSPALMAGYNTYTGAKGKSNREENYFVIGAGISPFSPYKKYLQAEVFLGFLNQPEKLLMNQTENKDTVINATTYRIIGREIYGKSRIILLDLVPLQLRYNINNWIGIGSGAMLSFDAYTKWKNRELLKLIQQPNPTPISMEKTYTNSSWFNRFDISLFGDLQFGRARVGPVLGIRYLHFFRYPQNRLLFYAAWRL